jgi:hypothetical protein
MRLHEKAFEGESSSCGALIRRGLHSSGLAAHDSIVICWLVGHEVL